ncbi:MAG: GNAT family N-acetyltransferase [Ferruginibacter sp.]
MALRQLTPTDAPEIFLLRSNGEVNKFIDRPKTATIDEAAQFIRTINDGIIKNESVYWAISLKSEPKLIGTICYWNIDKEKQHAEIGYELHPAFQGKGMMQEAIQEVINFGFVNMHLETITAFSRYDNKNSIKLLKKNNFSRDERLDQEMIQDLNTYVVYSLLKPVIP